MSWTDYAMQIFKIRHVKSLPRWRFKPAAAHYEESFEIQTLTHDWNNTETETGHRNPLKL